MLSLHVNGNCYIPADLEKYKDTSQLIYDVGTKFWTGMLKATTNEEKLARASKAVKILYFLYLTGCRIKEVLLEPPKITIFYHKKKRWVAVKRIVEKRFVDQEKTARDRVEEIFLADIEPEGAMWDFITDGIEGQEVTFDMRDFCKNENVEIKRQSIHHYFVSHFKIKQKNPYTNEVKARGITPHALRHWRAYNLKVEKGLSEIGTSRLIGWANPKMIYYYVDIQKAIQLEELMKEWDKISGEIVPKV